MISNYVLRSKIDALKKKQRELGEKKRELELAFRECGVSKNQAYKINSTGRTSLPEGTILNRSRLGKELAKIEKELRPIKDELQNCYSQENADKNMKLMDVFNEIFTKGQIIEIKKEAERRMSGEAPSKVSFSVKEAVQAKEDKYRYREIAKDQLEKMIEFRLLLTGLIEEGCTKFGDAEFLKFISPLNRLIIPVQELEKIKRKNNL
jgi:hypothetical protein